MKDGEYELDDTHAFFYLCGVGIRERHNTNVHLAVIPRIGSVAAVGSVYGFTFMIRDAQAIQIKHLRHTCGRMLTRCGKSSKSTEAALNL